MYAQERRGYSCARPPRQSAGTDTLRLMTAPPVSAVPVHEIAAEREDDAERALDVLLDSTLDPIVDMVLLARHGAYEARSHDGWVRFRRGDGGYERVAGGARNRSQTSRRTGSRGCKPSSRTDTRPGARTRTRSGSRRSPSCST